MSTVREDLDSFREFVIGRLADDPAAAPLDELFMEWHDRRSRDEIDSAIRRGLADVESGRHLPSDAAMEKIRNEFGFAKE